MAVQQALSEPNLPSVCPQPSSAEGFGEASPLGAAEFDAEASGLAMLAGCNQLRYQCGWKGSLWALRRTRKCDLLQQKSLGQAMATPACLHVHTIE